MALKTFTTADGSANQALVTDGSGVLSFAAVGAAAGQVIQVVTATDSTERSTSTGTYSLNSSTLTAAITPSAAANKILVLLTTGIGRNSTGTCALSVFRGSTNLGTDTGGFLFLAREDDVGTDNCSFSVAYLDSPNTTASTTYQIRFKANSDTLAINYNTAVGSLVLMEVKG